METLLKESTKFVEARAHQIKSDLSKVLASEKFESLLISFKNDAVTVFEIYEHLDCEY